MLRSRPRTRLSLRNRWVSLLLYRPMRNNPAGVADELGLPDEALVVFGMTIGIPDPGIGTDVKPRLPQNVILHRERYAPPDPALLAAYDQRIREFQAEQKCGSPIGPSSRLCG